MFWNQKKKTRNNSPVALFLSDRENDEICVPGYTILDRCPEVMTACRRIAELIGSLTIHLMENTEQGDKRIVNALSRKIDIEPMANMTRKTWMEAIVMNLLLYGKGNSIVKVHTTGGYLRDLEPIAASKVSIPESGSYSVMIDGIPYKSDEILHFVHNPSKNCLWKGQGLQISLRPFADNLKQAAATEKSFLSSKWKPSVIVKVDALTDEFSSPAGRKKLLADYVESSEVGEPWLIPAEQFSIEQIKPLSLSDLAISDVVKLNRRMIAAILGVPPFLLGVDSYNKDEWNAFVNHTVKPIVIGIQQEMTKKLILSPNMYIRFNVLSLFDWDIKTIADVFGGLSDRGFATGNEVRDRMGLSPRDGLDELRVLENYIPYEMSAYQKKLVQGGKEENGTK